MDNGGIQSQPFFNGFHLVVPKDGDSGDESIYAPSTRMYRVRRKRYLDVINEVISKLLLKIIKMNYEKFAFHNPYFSAQA